MTVQVTIIGLGQIGASIGLALAEHKDTVAVAGNDIDLSVMQKAVKLGAIQKAHYNLPTAVSDADLVILALPVNAIQETLKIIAPDLKEHAVVMDTAPVKSIVAQWMKELLPENRFYVGLVPAIGYAHLSSSDFGQAAAHANLFRKGLIGIVSVSGTPGEAVKLAADLTQLLGATSMFIDLAEADGLMAGVHLMPQLISTSLLTALVDKPGWLEAQRLASRPFASATASVSAPDFPGEFSQSLLANKENTLRLLDRFGAELATLRALLMDEDHKELTAYADKAQNAHAKWRSDRGEGDWMSAEFGKEEKAPTMGSVLKRMFIGHPKGKKKDN